MVSEAAFAVPCNKLSGFYNIEEIVLCPKIVTCEKHLGERTLLIHMKLDSNENGLD